MGQSAAELRRDIESTRAGLGDTLEAIGDRVSPSRMVERRKNRMAGSIRSVTERIMGTAHDTRQSVVDRAHSAKDMAGSTTEGAVESAKEMPQMIRTQAQGNPLTAGALAFGFGFLVAAALPATEKEKEASDLLLEKAQPLKDELSRSGHEIAEHLKEPAQQALQEVKGTATEGAQSVADTAKDAAQRSAEEAKSAAQNVRSEATNGSSGSNV